MSRPCHPEITTNIKSVSPNDNDECIEVALKLLRGWELRWR
jgi:hypothetical protein